MTETGTHRRAQGPTGPAGRTVGASAGTHADTFTQRDLAAMLDAPRSHCVSLYLATHPGAPDAQRDARALTNLVHDAEDQLVRAGLRATDARDIAGPARGLVGDSDFWRYRSDGLAVFLRSGWWRAFRLPLTVPSRAVVADRFHIVPLLPLLSGNGPFFVLALSENAATLYRGNRTGLEMVDVPDMPKGVTDVLRFDEPQRQRGHRVAGRVRGKIRTVLHGQGVGAETRKEQLGRYLRAVDHAVRAALRGRRAPLVLAGVDHVRAAYSAVTAYPHVVDAGIPGNPDRVTTSDLHARAWAIAEPVLARDRSEAADVYRKDIGTGLASGDLDEIVSASETGRVEVLFLSMAVSSQAREPVESAAVQTLRSGGTVYAVPGNAVPGGGDAAAVYRY